MIIERSQLMTKQSEIYHGRQLDLWMQDGVLCAVYKSKEIDLAVAMEATEERIVFTNNTNYPGVVDYRNVQFTSREARKYFASTRPAMYIDAMALIINSVAGALVTNFFIKIDRPKFPLRAFTDFHSAHDWASSFKPTAAR